MAYVIKGESAAAPFTSVLASAPLDRARDCLKLARMGSMESRREWNTWSSEQPTMARIVMKWCDQEAAEAAKATRRADKMLGRAEVVVKGKKADGICLKCHQPMREKHPRCKNCGAKNKFHVKPSWLERDEMKRKKLRRLAKTAGAGPDLLTKAGGRAAFAAMAPTLEDPDPQMRELAWKIHRGEVIWRPST